MSQSRLQRRSVLGRWSLWGLAIGSCLLATSPAMADCSGTEINAVCIAPHGEGDLELPIQSLSELQAVQSLQLTVTLAEEMELAIAAPQLIVGAAGSAGTQREASLTALGSTVTSDNGQAITLPAGQAISLALTMEALRPEPFAPDSYLYNVELIFTPTTAGGAVTTYGVDFGGAVVAACLQDGVAGGTLMPSLVNGLDSVGSGVAGEITNLRCNTDMTVTATTMASGITPEVSEFANCQVTFDQSALLDCNGSTAILLGTGSFPLAIAEVDLALSNYQAGMLPAGSYNYVVTLTFTP